MGEELTDKIKDLVNHLVIREGLGPNGSGGEVRYWKNGKDISAQKAIKQLFIDTFMGVLDGIEDELKLFTAGHDRPMRDEALEMVAKARAALNTSKGEQSE
jgi:hypothetical protein